MSISNKKFSSKDEDKLPMLPPSSDDDSNDELSPIEEEHCSSSHSSSSDASQSKYRSTTFLASSSSSVSSEVSSYKNLHEEYGTPTDHEFSDLETKTESDSSGNSVKSIKSNTSCRALRKFKSAVINYDEIEVDVQHENEEHTKTHNDPSHEKETEKRDCFI